MGVGGDSTVQSHSMGGVRGRAEGHTQEHTHTHTGTYTRMLHLPFSDLPFEKCPTNVGSPQIFFVSPQKVKSLGVHEAGFFLGF